MLPPTTDEEARVTLPAKDNAFYMRACRVRSVRRRPGLVAVALGVFVLACGAAACGSADAVGGGEAGAGGGETTSLDAAAPGDASSRPGDATLVSSGGGLQADSAGIADAAVGPDARTEWDAGPPDAGASDAGLPAVEYIGRFAFRDAAPPECEWSGSTMQARFRGTSAAAMVQGGNHYFEVVLDGVVRPTLATDGGSRYALATGLDGGDHEVVVFRRDEAAFNATALVGFDFGDGGELLPPPTRAEHRIEMIGDSITCGFGDECASAAEGFTGATENAYLAYGPLTARAFGADIHIVAWQGKGLYRNLDDSTTDTMPLLWQRTIPTDSTSTWDPSQWIPDVVVINLGTNDYDASGTDPSTEFQATYLDFVTQLESVYPNVFVFATVGPMLGGAHYAAVKTAISNVVATRKAAGDGRVQLVEFPTQDCADASSCGCAGHPNLAEHQKMATILEAAIHAALGW